MTSIVNFEIPRAEYLFPNQKDRKDLRRHAKQHRRNIDLLKRAVESGSLPGIRRCAVHMCRSFSSRLVAAIASVRHKQGDPPLSLAAMKVRAARIDAFTPNTERVRCIVRKKSGGRIRTICPPGPHRKALDWLCAEILDICLPRFDFDFMEAGRGGVDAADAKIFNLIEGGAHYVLTADINSFCGSIDKTKVPSSVPWLPATVVQTALLIRDDVPVDVTLTEEADEWLQRKLKTIPPKGSLPSLREHICAEPEQASRMGIPQGCSSSNLIARRALLGPLIAKLPFADRVAVYGDNISVAAATEKDARAYFETLRSHLENSPFGSLVFRRCCIRHVSQGIELTKYSVMRKSDYWGGSMWMRPANHCFSSFIAQVKKICETKGSDAAQEALNAYVRHWLQAFDLWHRTECSDDYLESTISQALIEADRHDLAKWLLDSNPSLFG